MLFNREILVSILELALESQGRYMASIISQDKTVQCL